MIALGIIFPRSFQHVLPMAVNNKKGSDRSDRVVPLRVQQHCVFSVLSSPVITFATQMARERALLLLVPGAHLPTSALPQPALSQSKQLTRC